LGNGSTPIALGVVFPKGIALLSLTAAERAELAMLRRDVAKLRVERGSSVAQ